jgi:sarcosine oxidase subunit delta
VTFPVPCPNCGPREVSEFSYGGEVRRRPHPESSFQEFARYLYLRTNADAPQAEWWFHRDGCRRWFVATRDTRTNRFSETGRRRPVPAET